MTVRPAVSVIVPFAGTQSQLERLLDGLDRLELRHGDELIVADNRPAAPDAAVRGGVRIEPARGLRSPAFARNSGTRAASSEWLVFIDADTTPSPALLDRYFEPAPAADTAVMAGAILDIPGGSSLASRHSAEREQMSQRTTLARPESPYAQTANCAVRRTAFEQVGGFDEGARAGEDADLCFRLARAGWHLEERPAATVSHRSRQGSAALLAQLARHGSGAAWLNRRYPGSFPPSRPRELLGRARRDCAAGIRALSRRRGEAAAFALLDLAGMCAFELGRWLPNRPRRH